MAGHTHQEGGPVCRFATKKACDEFFADWQAMQQVLLAYKLVVQGTKWWDRGDKTTFRQLMLVIAGEQTELRNGKGEPDRGPWARRLMRAIERVKAGDLPRYNLVEVPMSGTST